MKRFVRYLYEYESGKKVRNAGFVKIEAGNEKTIVNMHGKGFHNCKERELVLYLFYEENGEIIRVWQAEVDLLVPVLSWQLSYTVDDVGGTEKYSKINGIIVETGNGKRFAATWDDKPVENLLAEWKEKSECEEEKSGQNSKENESDDQRGQRQEQRIEQPPDKRIKKIRLQELSALPRCEWKLAHNQFLVHGYNNYHHLIKIEEGNILKIGVPGIYHIKEADLAEVFGFGEFLPAAELDISLEPEEIQQDEMFGYWCRTVRNRRR